MSLTEKRKEARETAGAAVMLGVLDSGTFNGKHWRVIDVNNHWITVVWDGVLSARYDNRDPILRALVPAPAVPDERRQKLKTTGTVEPAYGSPVHAAIEALDDSGCTYEGYVSGFTADVAEAVVAGLEKRGFVVCKDPRCECGWITGNHYHDVRMGRLEQPSSPLGEQE